ncbi:phosphatase PAP2 family protein [Leuconostoc lactis]|uniref:Phosphatase PAP2 family protein n=1 Tax=Leuconostoc lactis TaxID=1246 RepID=A0AAP9ECJ0_LEULA|nr:phosphatase PAP2 family protein [Leuconostoc lactis]MCC2744566.1 phosphatase PAP2 family protein [Leuconostoc lactis]MCC2755104.1 phosphatase PAP2 family protein [Leuconostoc lactis]QEA43939.1 phosphatase PAP2 family protein [Leuconostoc lactis]
MIVSATNKQRRHALICFLIACLLGLLTKFNIIVPVALDQLLHSLFNTVQSNFGDTVMAIATFLGNPVVDVIYAFILAGVLVIAQLRVPAIWTVVSVLLGDVVLSIIRFIVNRPRPVGHLLSDTASSFPSSHVFGLFVVIFIIGILVTPNINSHRAQIIITWLTQLIGALTIMSRLYFNANFLSDTVAAILFAYAWVIISATLYPKFATFLQRRVPLFEHEEI